jgi:hypothetical protein
MLPIPSVTTLTISHDEYNWLDENGLEPIEIIQHFPNVKNIHVEGNFNSVIRIVSSLFDFRNLEKFTASQQVCYVEDEEKFHTFIRENTSLQVLHMPSIKMDKDLLKFIADEFGGLTSFEFYSYEREFDIEYFTSKQNRLQHIGVYSILNEKTIMEEQFITMLDNLKNLTSLRIEHCHGFNDNVLKTISSGLRDIEIYGSTCITDAGLIHLAENCKSLRSIKTKNLMNITGQSILTLMSCHHINYYSPYAYYENDDIFMDELKYVISEQMRKLRTLAHFMFYTDYKLSDIEDIPHIKNYSVLNDFNDIDVDRNFLVTLRKYSITEIQNFLQHFVFL